MLKALFNIFRAPTEESSDQAPETPKKADNVADQALSTDKIKAIVAEINAHEENFKAAGFLMESIDIEIGIKSSITPHFKQVNELSDEEQNQVIADIGESSLIQFVVMSLFRSTKMGGLFENTEMKFHRVAIDITATPSVKTTFVRDFKFEQVSDVTHH